MKVRIITDSTADLPASIAARLTSVPLTVHFGDEEYADGVTITNQQFYEKLEESDVMPSTSQATPAAFDEVFRQVSDAGESAVVITLASQLSGTYQSATIAAADYDHIYVVDSGSVAIGSGILAELALSMADSGMEAKDIAARLETEKQRIRIVAVLDTLEYLKRGGRISKTVAFAGGLLNMKPVVAFQDGEIRMLGKARGSKQGNSLLTAQIQAIGGADFSMPLLLGYTGLSDAPIQKFLEDSQQLWLDAAKPLRYTLIGSVIGTHAGPGAVAVAFFQK